MLASKIFFILRGFCVPAIFVRQWLHCIAQWSLEWGKNLCYISNEDWSLLAPINPSTYIKQDFFHLSGFMFPRGNHNSGAQYWCYICSHDRYLLALINPIPYPYLPHNASARPLHNITSRPLAEYIHSSPKKVKKI